MATAVTDQTGTDQQQEVQAQVASKTSAPEMPAASERPPSPGKSQTSGSRPQSPGMAPSPERPPYPGMPPGHPGMPPGHPGMPPGPPVMQQPQFMPQPSFIPADCPPGLEYLTTLDRLFIKQKIELLEAITGFETANKYSVENGYQQRVFFAAEDSGCLARICLGKERPFKMRIFDNFSREVITMDAPYRCSNCCFPCFLKEITVESPPGVVIGMVKQRWSICIPTYSIVDEKGEEVLRIKGPLLTCSLCGDVEFQVLSKDEAVQVGVISKKWSGLVQEMFTDADNFGVSFPLDLSVKAKATLMAAVFMIDFMFFEESGHQKDQNKVGFVGPN